MAMFYNAIAEYLDVFDDTATPAFAGGVKTSSTRLRRPTRDPAQSGRDTLSTVVSQPRSSDGQRCA
jgi:ribosomal protein S19E (S16A)